MIKYGEHRGTLAEAMKTVIEFSTRKELFDHIKKSIIYEPLKSATIKDLKIRKYCYDKRIDWDTYIVLLKDVPMGFTNGMLK